MGVADHAVAVDDEHAPPREAERTERAIGAGHVLVGVGEQREVEPVLAGERLVAVDRLRRDAHHLSVERTELIEASLYELSCFVHTGVSSPGIEHEHDRLAGEVGQRVLPATRARQA